MKVLSREQQGPFIGLIFILDGVIKSTCHICPTRYCLAFPKLVVSKSINIDFSVLSLETGITCEREWMLMVFSLNGNVFMFYN